MRRSQQEGRMIEVTYTEPNAERDLARALIGTGVEPGEMLVNGVPVLRGTLVVRMELLEQIEPILWCSSENCRACDERTNKQ
jgi:hypothetical protein